MAEKRNLLLSRFWAPWWLCWAFVPIVAAAEGAGPKPAEQELAAPAPGQRVILEGVCGKVGSGLTISFGAAAKSPVRLELRCRDMVNANHHYTMGKLSAKDFPDAAIELKLFARQVSPRPIVRMEFIRPDLHFYLPDSEEFKTAKANWLNFPAASKHRFQTEIASVNGRIELRFDGRYFTSFPVPNSFERVRVKTMGAGSLVGSRIEPLQETPRFLPLALSPNPFQDGVRRAEASMKPGLHTIEGVPLEVAAPGQVVDVGPARWLRQDKDSGGFYDPYYRRSAWDGVPETVIFSVPRRHYQAAHLLCAVRRDGGRSPDFSLRLGRYRQAWDGAGPTQADTSVTMDPAHSRGCTSLRKAGQATILRAGVQDKLDLYLARIPLKTGELAGLFQLEGMDYSEPADSFSLELTRELLLRRTTNHGIHEWKPLGPKSGLLVFAITLEKAPVEIQVKSPEPGYVLYRHQKPALQIAAHNPQPRAREVSLSARLENYFGKVRQIEKKLTLPPGDSEQAFDLSGLEVGWYQARFSFTDAAGRLDWTVPVRFALLPPDTRQAGEESPFGIWWFKGSHYTQRDPDAALSLIRKLGFRHTTPRYRGRFGQTPEKSLEYGVTPSMMGYIRVRKNSKPLEVQAREFLEKWPMARWAMVFHETRLPGLGLGLPPELLGQPAPKLDPKSEAAFQKLWKQAIEYAETIRAIKPDLRIMLGNGATPGIVHWLRAGFPRKYWDALGLEMAVQKFMPESQPTGWNLQGLWIARKMADLYGYKDLPITSCYEFDYRSTAPGALTYHQQADWYARDALHCLAYRLPNINIGLLDDCNSAYYTSRWGASAVCTRAPLMMPKPSFVSLATLTLVLDRAEYQRYLDLSTTGAYALEFKKPEGGLVYALWAATGRRKMRLTSESPNAPSAVIDSMGRRHPFPASKNFTISESPIYLTAPGPVRFNAGKPEHTAPSLANAVIIDSFSDPGKWHVLDTPDEDLANWCAYSPMALAEASLKKAADGSTELTLVSQPDLPGLVGRMIQLEPTSGPIPIPGRPDTLGVWIRGNSNWGRIFFQVLDAKGRCWSSNGAGNAPKSWDLSDWICDNRISFDGWKLLTRRLPDYYEGSGYYGPNRFQWRCLGETGKHLRLAYPLKFKRLIIVMREKLVYLTDLLPARSLSIRLKGLTAGNRAVSEN